MAISGVGGGDESSKTGWPLSNTLFLPLEDFLLPVSNGNGSSWLACLVSLGSTAESISRFSPDPLLLLKGGFLLGFECEPSELTLLSIIISETQVAEADEIGSFSFFLFFVDNRADFLESFFLKSHTFCLCLETDGRLGCDASFLQPSAEPSLALSDLGFFSERESTSSIVENTMVAKIHISIHLSNNK